MGVVSGELAFAIRWYGAEHPEDEDTTWLQVTKSVGQPSLADIKDDHRPLYVAVQGLVDWFMPNTRLAIGLPFFTRHIRVVPLALCNLRRRLVVAFCGRIVALTGCW